MIKLKIKTFKKKNPDLPLNYGGNKTNEIIEKVIDFNGTCNGKFITQEDDNSKLTWCPILYIDGWEVIGELKQP